MTEKRAGFAHVETWVFDLDNTLYQARHRLFDQIDHKMGAFISNLFSIDRTEARRMQKDYFYRYGTTLRGLMNEHNVHPDDFLSYVHDIDHSVLPVDELLISALDKLEGRKLIFTNGTVEHAESVLAAAGISGRFDDIFDIKASDYEPKPALQPYQKFIAATQFEPTKAAMFEDIARNLEVPHELGMVTVLVADDDNEDGAMINKLNGDSTGADYVHHVTDDLGAFLHEVAI
ncbi:MAG: pyrimidine 5'-nucleotidase [Hyphomicrobiales bacterium]|nr:pyrimidine 5'-nucleotidase [Hyphomicrobiales bacterium]